MNSELTRDAEGTEIPPEVCRKCMIIQRWLKKAVKKLHTGDPQLDESVQKQFEAMIPELIHAYFGLAPYYGSPETKRYVK